MKINPNKLSFYYNYFFFFTKPLFYLFLDISPANIINTDFQEKSTSLMRFLFLVKLLNFTLEIYVPIMVTAILKIEYNAYSYIKF